MNIERDAATRAVAGPLLLGTNQTGMRAQNERLVLTLVRQHGALTKAEIARMTGLSAQTVSVIMRQLEAERLLCRGEPQRGKVGQPSIPLSLHPEGAYFLGLKVGRRTLDLVLVNFVGTVRHRARLTYPVPRPEIAIDWTIAEVARCEALLGHDRDRIAGLGIAMPFEIWNWAEAMGAPAADIAAWREVDLRDVLSRHVGYPVYLENDGSAACGAELVFGDRRSLQDFIYIYVGSFVGGGVVLNGGLYVGRSGNAGAIGSMPVPGASGTVQLIDRASLVLLERSLVEQGLSVELLYSDATLWESLEPALARWIDGAAEGLAHAVLAAAAVIDFEVAVIDGSMPPEVRARLVAATDAAMARLDTAGIVPPVLLPGSLGPLARALGGASLPLSDRYLIEAPG
jgi:predicted NBD/HSP70 family sugar kinase